MSQSTTDTAPSDEMRAAPGADISDELGRRIGSLDEVARHLGVPTDQFQAFVDAAKAGRV
ncbi:MAG: hypothetical protein QOD10_3634 [Mycobacterium sp.]|jgi:hypothetical protein|nr:hypothetical protein [Mycobacterium sp.]